MLTINRTAYDAFGLTISSEIPFPELASARTSHEHADLVIAYADLAGTWAQLGCPDSDYVITELGVFYRIAGVAVFQVQDGARVYVSPLEHAEKEKIRLYLLGTVMGTVLLQRGMLPLHGSAVVIDGGAYAFVGDSGAGKSTLAAAFLDAGYELLTDDVIAVRTGVMGEPEVVPAYPQQKLWQESLDHMKMDANEYEPLYQEVTKFAVPVSAKFHNGAVPLKGIFELVKTEKEAWSIRPLNGLQCLPLLSHHTYRSFLIGAMRLIGWHFEVITRLLNRARVYRVERSVHTFTAPMLVEEIVRLAHKEELQ
ncbi:aldolase [Paenibacillus aurantiacus]|uniref:Aldolase n=1 Tax=Paenibacillus aurantiacus TaxID=1936118 RepID=A0ABV5L0H5_9BACL